MKRKEFKSFVFVDGQSDYDIYNKCNKEPIDQLLDIISKYKEAGATHVQFDYELDYDCCLDKASIFFYNVTEETDAEYVKRIAIETQEAIAKKERDDLREKHERKKRYLELKKEFEG